LPNGDVRVHELQVTARDVERLLRGYERQVTGDMLADRVNPNLLQERLVGRLDRYVAGEREVLQALLATLTAEDRRQLLDDYHQALSKAPTRPHPVAPHTGWLGRLALHLNGVRDRIRDQLDSHDTGPTRRLDPPTPLTRWGSYLTGSVNFDERGQSHPRERSGDKSRGDLRSGPDS
jgi:hypothetical protein